MTVAFLFNSNHPQYEGFYGTPIRNLILSSNILQLGGRHMKISIGDVLIPIHQPARDIIDLSNAIYFHHPWKKIYRNKLQATYLKCTIYAWVIQNITEKTATDLHLYLSRDDSYLGVHGVDFSYAGHLALYRNSMIPMYRTIGMTCYLYERMGDDPTDRINNQEERELVQLGFKNVIWENIGARHTIFDDFDTLEHFQQVKEFEKIIALYLDDKEDGACELSMLIEDANPRLFNSLGASIRALDRAKNEEDYAQAGLSIRRFIENLTDTVFPAKEEKYNGRDVGKTSYKNRIWAYISDISANDSEKIRSLGKELDRLLEGVNSVIHSEADKSKVLSYLIDLSRFTLILLNLSPVGTIDPNYPYNKQITEFVTELLRKHEE